MQERCITPVKRNSLQEKNVDKMEITDEIAKKLNYQK